MLLISGGLDSIKAKVIDTTLILEHRIKSKKYGTGSELERLLQEAHRI